MQHLHCAKLLQERVWEDVAVATSFRPADRSWARRFAVANPRFIGCRSISTVLSQDCLGRPILRLQLSGGPEMQAWRARWWSCPGSAQQRCPMKDRRQLRTVSDRNGCPVRERISSLVTNSDQCMFRIRLRHQLSNILHKLLSSKTPKAIATIRNIRLPTVNSILLDTSAHTRQATYKHHTAI